MRPTLFPPVTRLTTWLCILALLMLGLAACAQSKNGVTTGGTTYEVSSGFREVYRSLGGEEVLGPAISQSFSYETYECQYTVTSLMCLNPSATGTSRYFLYPLGMALGVREEPVADAQSTSSFVVNGFPVYEEFIAPYNKLSGVTFAGNPITQARMNYSQQRIEQYFENVGFYRNFSDPAGKVKLLAYGAASCGERCNYQPTVDAAIRPLDSMQTDQVFSAGLEKIGDTTLFGAPLTQAYLAADGMQEQVYQNAVIYAAPGSNAIHLRPVPMILGLPTTIPAQKIYGSQEGMVFYPVDGALGYHVPILFDDFITAHGGIKISGYPIAEVSEILPGTYRQCFENYCIDYLPANPQDEQIALAALGSLYLDKLRETNALQESAVISPSTVLLQVSEKYKLLRPGQSQTISISLRRQTGGEPVPGLESRLLITLPSGTTHEEALPATTADGTSSIIVSELKGIPNGSILPYQVCLTGSIAEPVCAESSFVIWTLP